MMMTIKPSRVARRGFDMRFLAEGVPPSPPSPPSSPSSPSTSSASGSAAYSSGSPMSSSTGGSDSVTAGMLYSSPGLDVGAGRRRVRRHCQLPGGTSIDCHVLSFGAVCDRSDWVYRRPFGPTAVAWWGSFSAAAIGIGGPPGGPAAAAGDPGGPAPAVGSPGG